MAGDIPILPHVRVLRERYPAWLCDVWGVLHNGVQSFAGAVDALTRFRADGGTVVLVTNAPRPSSVVMKQLERLGVSSEAYDAVVTSGDASRDWVGKLGQRPAFHIGPERDRSLFSDLDLNLVTEDDADVAICTGLFDDTSETADDYRKMLQGMAERKVELLCANPDLVVDRGGVMVPCAGAIGKAYAEIGGTVVYAGKPYRPIYDLAIARISDITGRPQSISRLLAIGDGLGTDIAGANAMGIDTLFVIGGIHIAEVRSPDGNVDGDRLAALFASVDRKPIAAQPMLVW